MLQSKYLREEKKQVWYELKWQTPDGQELFAQCWDAGENAKAGILLVHGIGEHSSRYDKWANYLNREGFSVLSFDLRGHGKTPGQKGTFANYTKLLEDLDLLLEQGKKLCSEKPLFLYGHSFGGNLVANYAIRNQLTVQGIILTSPWFELSFTPPRHKLIAASILSRFAPRITSPNGLKPEDVSRELREVHKYRTDPLIHNKISVGLFMKAYENGLLAKKSIYKINVPLLIIHGTSDKITSYKASKEFVMNASNKTTFHEIEGGYHELHNDSDNEKVFNLITDWINNHLPK